MSLRLPRENENGFAQLIDDAAAQIPILARFEGVRAGAG